MNSIVAILSGVCSDWLVNATNTKRAPFMTENYGDSHQSSFPPSFPSSPPKDALKALFTDKRILAKVSHPISSKAPYPTSYSCETPALKVTHQISHHST
ncbi:uncharacterized protein RCO7_14400 [Rhynchosporium graminicola]|uniref:Uncharacterized protein n=1 Tax=Rhynchosporium graminicola TaxID=2792576 RepID=A0A1E1KH72_9HELO|nr:uncharacterized protein RCO7_14400 [Rhynchosporium commune]